MQKCRKKIEPDEYQRNALDLKEGEEVEIYEAVGCEECNNTGYRGRIAVYEIMSINREIRDLIAKNENADVIKEAALRNGMKTLRMNCARVVKNGVTTIDEMLRIAYSED